MEEVYKALKEVIECITNSKEYRDCISIKKKMEKNQELIKLIEDIKNTFLLDMEPSLQENIIESLSS